MFILAVAPVDGLSSAPIMPADFPHLLKEFGISSSTQVPFRAFCDWWEKMGCIHKGVAAHYFRVAETGARDAGSAHMWVDECLRRIERFEQMQAAVKLQSAVRQRQATRLFAKQRSSGMLPGSKRVVAVRIQKMWRMFAAKTQFATQRMAALTIQCKVRSMIATRVYKEALIVAQSDGYDLAANSKHYTGNL
jgi:hypothetical protein